MSTFTRKLSGAALLGALALGTVPALVITTSTQTQAKIDDGDGSGNSGGGAACVIRKAGKCL